MTETIDTETTSDEVHDFDDKYAYLRPNDDIFYQSGVEE